MTTYVALLRGINVGGHNKIPMAALRQLLEEQGFAEPRTVLQSGNAVFRGATKSAAVIERELEKATAERLGVTCDYIVRTAAQWKRLMATNPFQDESETNADQLLAMCFKTAVTADAAAELQASIKGPELVRLAEGELYIYYPADIGHSRLTGAVIERKLCLRGTARNWNTVRKLAAMINV